MKICESFEQAFESIPKNPTIFVHAAAATPVKMLEKVTEFLGEKASAEFIHLHTEGEVPYAKPEFTNMKISSLFTGKNLRGKIDHSRIDYLPCFLSEIPLLFRRGIKKVDVALIQVSAPDKHGHVSLGVSVDVAKAAVEVADLVIAHINPQMPRVHGSGFIHIDDIDYGVELSTPIYTSASITPSEIEMQIGKHVAELVEDHATIQLGIGSIPDAVAKNLMHHKDLGLHTEMWSNGAYDLIKAGIITNKYKKFHQGISVSSFCIGHQEMYDYIHDNMQVINCESDYTNFPINIMRNPKVTAINSAVEIDLTGQVCADSIGHKVISGVGGQMDFMRAAALSEGGKPILALPSRTNKGIPRITPCLKPGAGVVTTRPHVHYVVTEYGSVYLFGKTLDQRAEALISIAHPEDREMLRESWNTIKKQVCP